MRFADHPGTTPFVDCADKTDKDLSNPYLSAEFVIDFCTRQVLRAELFNITNNPPSHSPTAASARSLWQHHQHHNRPSPPATSNPPQQVTERGFSNFHYKKVDLSAPIQ